MRYKSEQRKVLEGMTEIKRMKTCGTRMNDEEDK